MADVKRRTVNSYSDAIQHTALLTLATPLKRIPRYWLEHIEPRIQRPEDTNCWLWQGAVNGEGTPIVPHWDEKKGRTTRQRGQRYIASLFWTLDPRHEVWAICHVDNCFNPSHLMVSRRGASRRERAKMRGQWQFRPDRKSK